MKKAVKTKQTISKIIENTQNIIENEKKIIETLKLLSEVQDKIIKLFKKLFIIILVLSNFAFFRNELTGLIALVVNFVKYIFSLWPRMSAGEQMTSILSILLFFAGWALRGLWNKPKN